MNESEARARLRRIGQRRKRLREEQDRLKHETAEVINEAAGVIPIKEAADLTSLNRSTVYELYLDLNGKGEKVA